MVIVTRFMDGHTQCLWVCPRHLKRVKRWRWDNGYLSQKKAHPNNIIQYQVESADGVTDPSVLKSPFKLKPGEKVELRTCNSYVSHP